MIFYQIIVINIVLFITADPIRFCILNTCYPIMVVIYNIIRNKFMLCVINDVDYSNIVIAVPVQCIILRTNDNYIALHIIYCRQCLLLIDYCKLVWPFSISINFIMVTYYLYF